MEFTVTKISIVVDGKQGYAFIDKKGNTILIIYGDAVMKNWTNYFKQNDKTNCTVRKPELEEAYSTF
jgi:hypothetical protein